MQDFIEANKLPSTTIDPTKTYQIAIRKTINSSRILIPQDTRRKYINMNPSAPTIKGLIKLHKQDEPIRPVVNWCNAPAYKLAQLFTKKVNHLAPLPNAFNITNSKDLIHRLNHTPVATHFHLASLDISNLYTNIPIKETQMIFTNIPKQHLVHPQTQVELTKWYETITKQNYFSYKGNILTQKEGLAMGAPSSSLITEMFLQHTEHQHLPQLSAKHKIINYFR
jgi:hypothetical protein